MNHRRLRAFALCLLLLLSLSGCWAEESELADEEEFWGDHTSEDDSAAQQDGRFSLTQFALPFLSGQTFDPITCPDGVQQTVASLLYEGLFALDAQFEPQPVLCASYTYDAASFTYVFTLRSGVTFSDGSTLSAADVLATYRRAAESERYAPRFSGIASMRASGDTLTVTLTRANARFPALLDIPIVKSSTEDDLIPLGTGAYLYVSGSDGPELRANAAWWRGVSLPLARIALAAVKDNDTAVSLFNSYGVHFLLLDPTGSGALPSGSQFDMTDISSSTMLYLGFHTGRAPLADASVRSAMSARIDRDALVSSLLSGHAQSTQFPLSPQSPLYPQALEYRTGAADYAAALESAGLTDGTGHTLTLLVNEENRFKCAVAESLCTQLSTAALTVTLRALPWNDYLAALEGGNFDLYLGEVRLRADWDISSLLDASGTLNYGGYASETMSALHSAALEAGEGITLERFYRAFAEETPIAPLLFKTSAVFTPAALIDGLSSTAANPFYGLENWSFRISRNP